MAFAPPFNRTCHKVTVSRNEWGDRIEGVTTPLACHFRQIDTQSRVNHGEEDGADAMVWFAAGTSVVDGDTLIFDGVHYQIERIVKVVRLGSDTIEFIKCDLKVIDLGIS